MPEKVDDKTVQPIVDGIKPDGDVKPDVPVIDKEVHEKAVASQKTLDGLLEKSGFENVDELIDGLESGSALAKQLGGKDLDAIIKAADTLEGYEKHWAAEEAKLKTGIEPDEDDRITALEKTVKDFKDEQTEKETKAKEKRESQEALDLHEATVAVTAKENEIPEGQLPFFKEFMGVDNPLNEVDLDDKAAVRKALKGQSKKYSDFVQTVIKGYTDGKIKMVEIKPVEPVVPDKPEAKNLKEARSMAMERFKGFFNKS